MIAMTYDPSSWPGSFLSYENEAVFLVLLDLIPVVIAVSCSFGILSCRLNSEVAAAAVGFFVVGALSCWSALNRSVKLNASFFGVTGG